MNESSNEPIFSAPENENPTPLPGQGLRESLLEHLQDSAIQIQSMQTNCRQNCCQSQPAPEPCGIAYQAALPYPLVKPQCKNSQYAAAMLDNMAGQNSEMSAIGFYLYSGLVSDKYREVADTVRHINMVEMHHLEIFGSLAMQLGENPRLWSRCNRKGGYHYWSPAFMKYPPFPLPAPVSADDCTCSTPTNQSIKLLLTLAIDGEKEAIRKYMQQTTWIQDVNVCDNLRRISADEQLHLDILTQLYHKF